MTKRTILQIEPWIDRAELDELTRVTESTFVVEHDLTREFEQRIRELSGSPHAVAMTNGTAALFCCLKALGIGPGDEVIVPDLTFVASANAVIMTGARPRFCDVDPRALCLDPAKAEPLINERTRAIMPVHLYGVAADMPAILNLARRHGLRVIEDAAQGVGVRLDSRHVGTFGDLGILSFYGNKTLTCGEGGVVLTADKRLALECYKLKNHGRTTKGVFIHESIGFNFSFTEMQAAVGVAQLKKLDAIIEKKARIRDRYVEGMADVDALEWPYVDPRVSPVFWFTSVFVDDVEDLSRHLAEKGIQTRRFFYPLHRQPCYDGMGLHDGEYPVSARAYERGLSLPSSYMLREDDQNYVIDTIRAHYAK